MSAITKAYIAGAIVGPKTAPANAVIEIFNHAWNHKAWTTMSDADRATDLGQSTAALRKAYTRATIATFVPPENRYVV